MNRAAIIMSVIGGAILLVLLGAVYVATNKPAAPAVFPQVNVIKSDDHIKWSPAKKNILVEYSDLQCPACKAFHEIIKTQVETEPAITGKITFVYRHFPLEGHQFSTLAAYANEAAGRQGKFFEMQDLIFDTQDTWSVSSDPTAYFIGLAQKLKLDTNKFKADMNSDAVKRKVQADRASGAAAALTATPTFYLNGAKLDLSSFEDFKKLLKETASR